MVDLVEYLLKPHHKMFNYCIFKSKKFFLIYSYVRFTSDGTGPFFTNNSFGVIVPPLVLLFLPALILPLLQRLLMRLFYLVCDQLLQSCIFIFQFFHFFKTIF